MTGPVPSEGFVKVPQDIHFFISHPCIAKVASSPVFAFLILLAALFFSFVLVGKVMYHRKVASSVIFTGAFFILYAIAVYAAPYAVAARNPASSTVIAAIIVEKKRIEGIPVEAVLFDRRYRRGKTRSDNEPRNLCHGYIPEGIDL